MFLFFKKIISIIVSLSLFVTGIIPGMSFARRVEMLEYSYGDSANQVYDVVYPARSAKKEYGLLLYVHGGGWVGGEKDSYLSSCRGLSKFGVVCATMNYRFADENTDCYDMLDDIESAIAQITKVGAEKGYNITKVLLAGSSAGAHLSLLYAYTRANTCPIKVVAVYSRSGPTDFMDDNYLFHNVVGDFNTVAKCMEDVIGFHYTIDNFENAKPYLEKASPVNYITKDSVPTLICHGKLDDLIPFSNSVTLDKKLTECGVKHDYIPYPNSDHTLGDDPLISAFADVMFFKYIFDYLV